MASRALKAIFGFRKWLAGVEFVLYLLIVSGIFLVGYRLLFGGGF